MLKNYVIKCAILLTFLRIVCGESIKCPTNYWPCKKDQCIRNEEVCDGAIHCSDGSDETKEQCLLIPCPSYAFQCAYGGCITGNFKCNGIKDCADGSDENRYLCNNALDFGKEIQGTCKTPSTMQCKSGECISDDLICDGMKDCGDGSDETVELCSFEKCSYDSFRCGYGACIAGSKKCDYNNDCLDGSDEFANVCVLGYRSSVNHTQTTNTSTHLFPIEAPITPLQISFSYGSSDASTTTGCSSHELSYNNNNSTNNCELYYWPCKNGKCIRSEELCDGTIHCSDGSDETVEQCLLTPCPSFAFQCTYGGCIAGNFKCNGIVDCADGSDESIYLCNTDFNFVEDIQGACRSSEMECQSKECIDIDKVCDGQKDCSDGSDETVELCNSFHCPPFAFRCGYGACIAGFGKCNAFEDCMDGSDELPRICGTDSCNPATSTNATTTTTTTAKPTKPTDDSDDNVFPVTNKYCSSHTLKKGISTQKECFYNNMSVSCYHHLQPGTRAHITCASGYIEKRQNHKKPHILKCDNNGKWSNDKPQCIPECGTLTDDQKNNTIKPWDLSIFKRNYDGLYSPICSGVIVSPKIVLTAAKCLMNHDDNGFVTDHVVYNVIQGFYNMTYRQGDPLNVKVHNISKIRTKKFPRTEDLAVLILVNYFKFSIFLKPICLPNIADGQQLVSDGDLNIGRPYVRDNSKIYLDFLKACEPCERMTHLTNYVNIYQFLRFINKKIKDYNYLL